MIAGSAEVLYRRIADRDKYYAAHRNNGGKWFGVLPQRP